VPEVRRPSALECAFFAGFFDAEGCLRVESNHGRFWQAYIVFKQNKPAVLLRLRETYGGAIYVKPNGQQKVWQLKRYGAVACFLQDILPYVGEKRTQVEVVLARFSSRMSGADGAALKADLAQLKRVVIDPAVLPSTAKRRCCGTTDCTHTAVCRGLCSKHYQQAKRDRVFTVGAQRAARPFAHKRTPTQDELAYAGGYFDGDGNVGLVAVRGRWYPRVAFMQTRSEGVLRMWEVYGGSLKFQRRRPPARPTVIWRLTSRDAALAFLRDILPFTVEKRDQIEYVLAEYRPDLAAGEGKRLAARLTEMHEAVPLVGDLSVRCSRPRLEVAVIAAIRRGASGITGISREVHRRPADVSEAIQELVEEGALELTRVGKGGRRCYSVSRLPTPGPASPL
jgi:hypothetical protein